MAQTQQSIVSPFAQLIDPVAFSAAVAHSDRLARLKSRVCRPLDKPLIPLVRNPEQERFDREVEHARARDLAVELAYADTH